jgi:hypothetical protein
MKTDTLRRELLQRLQPASERHGFLPRSKGDLDLVFHAGSLERVFRVSVISMTGWFKVQSAAYIGSKKVIRLFNDILSRSVPSNGTTCGFGISNRFQGRGNYQVNVQEEVEHVANLLLKDFEEIALPFLTGFSEIEDIDRYLNAKDENGRYRVESVDRACMGLIAANLCGNPAFAQLAESYFKSYRESQGVALAQPILRVREYFDRQGNAAQQLPG